MGFAWYLALPASIAIAAVFGAVLALPALRVTGPYLAMVTLAFGTIIQILINEMSWLTEGPMGITVTKPHIGTVELSEVQYYYMVAIFMVASLLVVHSLLKSHLGRAFEALRDSPIASDCMGVSVYRYKVYAFVISAGFAGLAGSLYAYSEQYISPNTYNFELTILFLLAVIMGGRKSRIGSLLGALIVVLLPSLLSDIDLFRKIAIAAAVLAVVGSGIALAKKRTTIGKVAVPVIATLILAAISFKLDNMIDWAPDHFRPDDIVRRLLPAGRHRRVLPAIVRQKPRARCHAGGGRPQRSVCRHQCGQRQRRLVASEQHPDAVRWPESAEPG